MKRFFSSKVRTVLVIAVVLAAALTVIGNLTGSTPLDGVVKGLMTPISTAASHLKNGAAQLYSYLFRYEALAAENADLKEQLDCGVPLCVTLYRDQNGKTISRNFLAEVDTPPKRVSVEDVPSQTPKDRRDAR